MTEQLIEAYKRRLLAFHTSSPEVEVVEFYNHAHDRRGRFASSRGDKIEAGTPGAGGKMWTGVSAHPDYRVKPKPGSLPTTDREAVAFAKKTYEADLGNGYRSHVNAAETHMTEDGAIHVQGSITFNGRQRGFFERVISKDETGAIVAHHETLIIDGHHKGLGVADRFNAHAVAEYQKLGVDRITLKAGDADLYVGAYAWARQGFRYDGSDGARRAYLHKQLDRIDVQLLKPVLREYAKQVRKEVAALKKAIDAGEDVQPIHVASIGEKYARHTSRDDAHFEYTTWPGKSVLLGTSWNGVYYFDANRAITSAATDLEHASLRPAFHTEDLSFNPRQPRDKDGKWTVSVQHIANQENAAAILKGGFSTDTPAWDRSFGNGVYLSEAGDAKSAKFYARQGGRNWRTAQVIEGTVSLANPLHIEAREHSNFRAEVVKALGGTDAVRDMAQAKYDHTVAVTKKIVAEEVGADHGVPLDRPEKVNWYHVDGAENHPDTIFVSQRVEAASERIHERIKQETDGSPTENASWHYLAEGIERIAKPGVNTSSDNDSHYSELLGNLARDHGYDGIVIGTNRWGGVGGQQIVVFDPSTIKVTGSHPYAGSRTASAAVIEALACHDAACAPPPAGTGGSEPALQARRGVVPGYGPTRRRDITLGSVRVTYKPDYPDDHPDPGEVVWAKVRFQEDRNQSKDRPVLIIGRINGTDKLAAVQLTSNDSARPDRLPIGSGSWDRLGRNASIKLDQIIVVEPNDYRREGSKFDRDKFEGVIGRLAAFHRTPVQIAASAKLLEHFHSSGGIEFACHDASCRPPTAGGTGGSTPSGHTGPVTEINFHKFDPMSGDAEDSTVKHLGSLRVAAEMTDCERADIENDLDIEVKDFSFNSREPWAGAVAIANANVATVPRTTVGISVQLAGIYNRYSDDYKKMDKVTEALGRYENEYQTDLRGARGKLHRELERITGVSVASGFISHIHEQWANSAHSPESVAMQLIASRQLRLTGASAALKKHMTPGDLAWANTFVKKTPDALTAAFNATYRLTQRELAKHGITELTLYRGVSKSGTLANKIIAQPSPLSSWSTDQVQAFQFSIHGTMYKATVPASQAYSLANLSGTGSLGEREVILLGHRTTATVHELETTRHDDAVDHVLKSLVAAGEDLPVVDIDAEDFDWIKQIKPVAASAEEFYNHEHDPHSGKFTGHGAQFKVITAAQARGDSRPVSHDEFQRLANVGRTQLEGFARNAKKINLPDEQWSTIKREAYAEAVKPWGGATIDMHTGKQLPQGVNAYAITVKRLALATQKKSQNTVSIHENATEAEFHAAMETARRRFGYTLAREQHHLGVFHDDENHRIDFDPVLVVHNRADVDTIGAATHAIGGAYNFSDGNGYWPPHVAEG